jgi:hypothetical protein
MKIYSIIQKDYNAYSSFLMTIVCCISMVMFSLFIIFNFEGYKYKINNIVCLLIIFTLVFLLFAYFLFIRIFKIKRIQQKEIINGTIIECKYLSKDQFSCLIEREGNNNKKYIATIRISTKNKNEILNICQLQHIVQIAQLQKRSNKVIITDLFK